MAIGRVQGMPGARVQLSSRYIVVKRPYLSKGAADTALKRLREEGLLLQEKPQSGIYMLAPPPDPVALAELEERLGTASAHHNDSARARAIWSQAKLEKREYARMKEIEAQAIDRMDEQNRR